LKHLSKLHLSKCCYEELGSDRLILNYSDSVNCLNDLFWSLHTTLEKGQKQLVVLENEEDFKYLNYCLNVNNLDRLSLVIGTNENSLSPYTLNKLQSCFQGKETFKNDNQDLDQTLAELKKRIRLLHSPKLGKISIAQLQDRLNYSGSLNNHDRLIERGIFNKIKFEDYKGVKAEIDSAEKTFESRFRFVALNNPLSDEIIEEYSIEDILMVVKEYYNKAKKLSKQFSVITQKVQENFLMKQNNYTEFLHNTYADLLAYIHIGSEKYSLTETKKIEFYFSQIADLLEIKSIQNASINQKFKIFEKAYNEKVSNIIQETEKQITAFLERLTTHHQSFPELSQMFTETETLFSEFDKLRIAKKASWKRASAFSFLQNSLNAFKNDLEYIEHFLEDESNYISWLQYLNQTSPTVKSILEHLATFSTSWSDTFEEWYLSDFMNTYVPILNSISDMGDDVLSELKAYKKQLSENTISKFHAEIEAKDIKWIQSWTNLLGTQAELLSERFPLLICTGSFYEKHRDLLKDEYDKTFFLNYCPEYIWKDKTYWFFANNRTDYLTIKNNFKETQTLHIKENYFNINRSLSHLSLHELNACSLYLGQKLEQIQSVYRIFQIDNTTLISFFSKEKNSLLIESFRSAGIKEMFSNNSEVSLLPGIFSNPENPTIMLLEDGLINRSDEESGLLQLTLLDKIKVAGIKTLSLDNYLMITKQQYNFEIIKQKIISLRKASLAYVQSN